MRSPMVFAMRSALARAAIRRGSSTMIFLFFSHGSSSSASGTRVVLPAPGGATSTAALWRASVRARSSRTASIGSGVSKERGNYSSRSVLPLSPCGRGWLASSDARRMRGLCPRIQTPHPPTILRIVGTFSHKERREGSASLPWLGCPPDALIDKAERGHVLGAVDVAQVDDHGMGQLTLQPFQIERAILHPFGHHHHGVRAADAEVGIVAIFDVGQFTPRLLDADRVVAHHPVAQ